MADEVVRLSLRRTGLAAVFSLAALAAGAASALAGGAAAALLPERGIGCREASPVFEAADPAPGTPREAVEPEGISIPAPWKPLDGIRGRLAGALEVGPCPPEGEDEPGRAPGGPATVLPAVPPEGILHGLAPPASRAR